MHERSGERLSERRPYGPDKPRANRRFGRVRGILALGSGDRWVLEGQEIRASFQVKDEKNMATSISPSSGTGGSGSDPMAPDSSINEGTGGSGMDDKNQGTGNDSTMNPDTGSNTDSSSSPKTY